MSAVVGNKGDVGNKHSVNINEATGTRGTVRNTGAGRIDRAIGALGAVRNTGTGNIGHGFAFYASAQGEVENLYKIFIDDNGSGKAHNYAILSESRAPSYMAGKLGLGASDPDAPLHVAVHDQNTVFALERSGYVRLDIRFNTSNVIHDLSAGAGTVWMIGKAPKLQLSSTGQLSVGGNWTHDGASGLNLIAGVSPTRPPLDGVVVFSEKAGHATHLRVMDGEGRVTTLSPNNFSRIPGGKSEKTAWAYHAEQDDSFTSVDMMKAMRLLEQVSGQKLVHLSRRDGTVIKSAARTSAFTLRMLLVLIFVGGGLFVGSQFLEGTFSGLIATAGAACLLGAAFPAATLAQRSTTRKSQALFSLLSPAVIFAGLLVFQGIL